MTLRKTSLSKDQSSHRAKHALAITAEVEPASSPTIWASAPGPVLYGPAAGRNRAVVELLGAVAID